MKNRVISILIIVTMLMVIIPTITIANADVTNGVCGDNVTWTFDGISTLTIIGKGDIPNYSTSSNVPWYSFNSKIKSVIIEDGITSIGHRAFYGLRYLESISVADSVKTIGDYVFYDCDKLISIDIPNSVTSIGNYAFFYCISLKSLDIPDNVVTIGEYSFKACSGLETVTFGSGLTTIGKNAFENCKSLKSVIIPDNVTTLGTAVFQNCVALESVSLSNSLTTIPIATFYDCSALKSVVIPDEVTKIEGNAFKNCKSLTTLTIPIKTTSISSGAFYGHALADVYYSGSELMYEKISNAPYAANMHYSFEDVIISDSLMGLWDENAGRFVVTGEGDWAAMAMLPFDIKPLIKTVVIESGVTSVASYAFAACEAIETLIIPATVLNVEPLAFYGCNNINDIYFEGNASTYNALANAPKAKYMHFAIPCEHQFDIVVGVDATCTEDGYTSHSVCKHCDATDGKIIVGATGHSFTTKPSDKEAPNGGFYVQCDRCDAVSDTVIVLTKTSVVNDVTGETYSSIVEAISDAKSGETIKLTDNTTATTVVLNPGVTLDLNGYKLTVDYLVSLNGSSIVDNGTPVSDTSSGDVKGTTKTGGIVTTKDNISLSKNNIQLPLYDAKNNCYVFVNNTLRDDYIYYDEKTGLYIVTPIIGDSNGIRRGMIKDVLSSANILNSGFNLKVRVSWDSVDKTTGDIQYTATQDFIYNDALVSGLINSYGKNGNNYATSLSAVFKGDALKQADYVYVSTVLVSDSGVEIQSNITTIDVLKIS